MKTKLRKEFEAFVGRYEREKAQTEWQNSPVIIEFNKIKFNETVKCFREGSYDDAVFKGIAHTECDLYSCNNIKRYDFFYMCYVEVDDIIIKVKNHNIHKIWT